MKKTLLLGCAIMAFLTLAGPGVAQQAAVATPENQRTPYKQCVWDYVTKHPGSWMQDVKRECGQLHTSGDKCWYGPARCNGI